MIYREFEVKQKIKGEKILAEIKTVILPIVKKVFEPFDGERLYLSDMSSYSAKFKKARSVFADEIEKTGLHKKYRSLRIYANASHSTVSVKFDINLPNKADRNGISSCTYYKDWLYFGEVDSFSIGRSATGNFKYTRTEKDDIQTIESCEKIKKVTQAKIKSVFNKAEKKRKELELIENSLPHCFKELIKN